MKKVFLTISAFALLAVACGDDKGREVESEDAQEVVDKTTETTTEFTKVADNSRVSWFASHPGGIGPHNGFFKLSEGNVKVTDGKVTNGSITIDVTSLADEDIEDAEKRGKLEGHLKSADFLNAEKYPTATFEVTESTNEVSEDKKWTSKITGNLTMKDSTRSVTFWANVTTTDNDVTIKSERFSIDRTQWGIHYGAEGTPNLTEDQIISDAVGIEVSVTLTK